MLVFSEKVKRRHNDRETLDLIERFAVAHQELPVLTDVSLEKDVQRKYERIRAKEEELGAIAIELCYLKNVYCLLHQTLDTRLRNLSLATIYSLNTDNIIVFALVSRSLMENAALTACLCKQSFEKIESVERTCDCKTIRGELKGLRKKYERIFHRSGLKSGTFINNVDQRTLVQIHLSSNIKNAVDDHDFISDFVHPCFGGNTVIKYEDNDAFDTFEYTSKQIDMINRIISICGKTISCYSFMLMGLIEIAHKIDNYIKKTLLPSATLISIFSGWHPAYTGDGTSKETAIFFKNATTYDEHQHLQEQYIKTEKIKILGKRKCPGFDNGFTIDSYRTEAGHLYFRTPPISPE